MAYITYWTLCWQLAAELEVVFSKYNRSRLSQITCVFITQHCFIVLNISTINYVNIII